MIIHNDSKKTGLGDNRGSVAWHKIDSSKSGCEGDAITCQVQPNCVINGQCVRPWRVAAALTRGLAGSL